MVPRIVLDCRAPTVKLGRLTDHYERERDRERERERERGGCGEDTVKKYWKS